MKKSNNPEISVVIPAFNEAEYLPNCLESIKKQTFRDFEIIVVDNNSTDNTAQIAKSFGARVVRETVQGMIPARERGFREAKGDIIARTDADSVTAPNWLEVIYKTFQKEPSLVGITGQLVSPTKSIPDLPFKVWSFILAVILGKVVTGHHYLIGPNMAIKRKIHRRTNIKSSDKHVHEDFDLSCHLAGFGEFKFVPGMKATLSMRRLRNFRGWFNYLIEYPTRYFKTLWFHHKFLRRHKKL